MGERGFELISISYTFRKVITLSSMGAFIKITMKKIRLDLYLAENAFSQTREKAKKDILAGWVKVNGETIRTVSRLITGDEIISVERKGGDFVSRGGEKLSRALEKFAIDVSGKTILDLGASTGGFTDCLLKNGASLVYAVDVGYGQLDYSLRTDPRVIVMERKNARDLTKDDFTHKIDFITADLSFISIIKVMDKIKLLFDDTFGVILLKPQFESSPGEHKKGVVKNPDIHKLILSRTLKSLLDMNVEFHGLTFSPLKGPAGNIEFLFYFKIIKADSEKNNPSGLYKIVNDVVDEAHEIFNRKK